MDPMRFLEDLRRIDWPAYPSIFVLALLLSVVRVEGAGPPEAALRAACLGGPGEDWIWGMATHPSGDVVVVGFSSGSLPLEDGTFHENRGDFDTFVARLDPSLESLVSVTVLAGSGEDRALCLAIADDGTAVLGGYTTSPDFPVSEGAFDGSLDGFQDAFITLVDTDPGTPPDERIRYSTLVGEDGENGCLDIAVDGGGTVTALGYTSSPDFPVVDGALQPAYGGGVYDTFLVQLEPDGSMDPAEQLVYSTFIGGSDADAHPLYLFDRVLEQSLALDPSGEVSVVGITNSADFPTTPGAHDTTHNGGRDVYVLKILPDPRLPPAEQLRYGTFLGGGANDLCTNVAIDRQGDISVVGVTYSTNYPTTPGASSRVNGGFLDAFLTVLKPDLGLPAEEQVLYSTLMGKSDDDLAECVALGEDGRIYIVGGTWSRDFPVTPDAVGKQFRGFEEGFLTVLDLDFGEGGATARIDYSTFIGGSDGPIVSWWRGTGYDLGDFLFTISLGQDGAVYMAGGTSAWDLPVSPEGFQPSPGGGMDGAVYRLDILLPDACIVHEPAELRGKVPFEVQLSAACSSSPAGTEIATWAWDLGDGSTSQGETAVHTYPDPGRYAISLTVMNDRGFTSTAMETITASFPSGVVDPWTAVDIGNPAFPGSSLLTAECLVLCAGGKSLAGSEDQVHFVHREQDGDARLTARIVALTGGTNGAAGLMLRDDLTDGAPFASICLKGSNRPSFHHRAGAGSTIRQKIAADLFAPPLWLRLERRWDAVDGKSECIGWCSALESPGPDDWIEVGRAAVELPREGVLAGAFGNGADAGKTPYAPVQATFCSVELQDLPPDGSPRFARGDVNDDGRADISDPMAILAHLFMGGEAPGCREAADVNDDGALDLSDAIAELYWLFLGGPAPPSPGPPPACGSWTADAGSLGCERSQKCR